MLTAIFHILCLAAVVVCIRPAGGDEAALPAPTGGSFRVIVESIGFAHRSFMDLPLLNASDDPAASELNVRNLEIVIAYTRAFFDMTLKDRRPTLLDLPTDSPNVRVDRFGPFHRR
jgi:hypothetical protein